MAGRFSSSLIFSSGHSAKPWSLCALRDNFLDRALVGATEFAFFEIMRYVLRYGIFVIFPLLLLYGVWRCNKLSATDVRYTEGRTLRRLSTFKSGREIEYSYNVGGQRYNGYGADDYRISIIVPDGRYLVKYSGSAPSVSEIEWVHSLNGKRNSVPDTGWNEFPSFLFY
jgi:hypothetical protein